jgi:hypothetical protein
MRPPSKGTASELWIRSCSQRFRRPRQSRPQAIDDPRLELARLHAHTFSDIAGNATPLRDSRATLHGGSERFQAVGEAGSRPATGTFEGELVHAVAPDDPQVEIVEFASSLRRTARPSASRSRGRSQRALSSLTTIA